MSETASKRSPAVIDVRGAAEHNLKDLDVQIERGAITVVTGVSGSGKSSLAFDTVLAEAQRRFFHTLSHYSRQFLDLSSRPAVRSVSGLSPAIALAQNETPPSPRATVGTLTDISELLGVLFARFGERRCPDHGQPTAALAPADVADSLLASHAGATIAICAPLAVAKKGAFKQALTTLAGKGYLRVFIDGQVLPLTPLPQLAREEKHTLKLIVDFVKIKPESRARLIRALETALAEGQGHGEWYVGRDGGQLDLGKGGMFSVAGGCPECGFAWPRLDSRHFSANSLGRCEECNGYGVVGGADVSDDEAALELDGDGEGAATLAEACASCQGTGLAARLNAILVGGQGALSVQKLEVSVLDAFLAEVVMTSLGENLAARRVLDELRSALARFGEVGLGYLTPMRRVRTLSGGEAQRLKLAGVLGEGLRGVLYVLDEPSQGLHPTELASLWSAFERLKAQGNTVVIVDHDEALMRRADWIIDLGPGGGARGGRLLAKFRPSEAARFAATSTTARYLSGQTHYQKTETHAESDGKRLSAKALNAAPRVVIHEPRLHNLQLARAEFPIGAMTVVTGVSGAGKTSLAIHTLHASLAAHLARGGGGNVLAKGDLRSCAKIEGAQHVQSLHLIDRRPVAKSSVSIPASYLDVLGELRQLYAGLPEAQVLGLTARDFSLNAEGGRCPECKGRGELSLSMRFLADARVRCAVCQGQRFRPHVLSVRFAGRSLADVLNLTLDETVEMFRNHRKIVARLLPAVELGLGYLKLGQPTVSLSGGEAQRLKLVPQLSRRHGEGSVLILDEPTAGLHFEDVTRLVATLRRLVERGTTMIVIEHHPQLIEASDWVIELGPGAASMGGRLIRMGAVAR